MIIDWVGTSRGEGKGIGEGQAWGLKSLPNELESLGGKVDWRGSLLGAENWEIVSSEPTIVNPNITHCKTNVPSTMPSPGRKWMVSIGVI